MAEMTLIDARFGMGNQLHNHVHRNNQFMPSSQDIDELKMEQLSGGILGTTMNAVAERAGEVSAQPQGFVNIEDGWNQRRGLGMLRFSITENSMVSESMTVLGYIHGGQSSIEGFDPQTLFVPVRCWTTSTTSQINPVDALPMTSTHVTESSQFLMGDPNLMKELHTVRPMDVGNGLIGIAATDAEGRAEDFAGVIGTNLNQNGVIISKTHNLNPTHHARELLKMTLAAGSMEAKTMGIEAVLPDMLSSTGMGEQRLSQNPFMATMRHQLGMHSFNGFQGFSIGDINNVFTNFLDVVDVRFMDPSLYAQTNYLLSTNEYGGSSFHEIYATEIAFLTLHLMINAGLTSIVFSASNDQNALSSMTADEGMGYVQGHAMSVMENDMYLFNRTETFRQALARNFFNKLNSPYEHMRTIISVEVECHLFGETTVKVFLNGDESNARTWANATYAINRTSTNIAGSDVSRTQCMNAFQNIKEHFDIN